MDRTDPGISLFQGKGPKLDLTADRLAEEEELADHKRREDEVRILLNEQVCSMIRMVILFLTVES